MRDVTKLSKVFAVIVAVALLLWGVAGARTIQPVIQATSQNGKVDHGVLPSVTALAPAYYLAPHGDDNNSGDPNSPWKTLAHALTKLSPGDSLYLRGGVYYEHDVTTGLQGTAAAPITIQSFPGEHAILDGGVPDFKVISQGNWELVDSGLHLYRSKQTFSGSLVRAWLVAADIQLVEYSADQDLESTNYGPVNGRAALYIGPGVQLRADGHIYIRLQSNPNDLTDPTGKPITPTPVDTDPNNNKIDVFTSDNILLLNGAAYLHFKDLEFSYSKSIMDVTNGSNHIELDGCNLNYGTYGLVIRDGSHDWDIHDNNFNNGFPGYVYWTDVKNGPNEVAEAYPEFQSAGLIGSMANFNILRNTFRDSLDALDINDGTINTRIANNVFVRLHDDALELPTAIGNVEVAHNMLWHVASGISIDGSTTQGGPVYIHHNVIDDSAYQRGGRPGNFGETNWPVWTTLDPFGSHDKNNNAAWWKVYNNTIVTRRSGYQWDAAGPTDVTGSGEKYVYNNIFYVIDDRVVFRDDQAAAGSHYDGNIIYRKAPGRFPLFVNFGNGHDYSSLADFRSSSGTTWEANGLEIDPRFDLCAINDPTFNPATVWERYRPSSAQVFTPGASYSGLSWPGIAGVNYRGALPLTSAVPQIGQVMVLMPLVLRSALANC
jgi:hypothetical protein